jgi:TPR repeat protein
VRESAGEDRVKTRSRRVAVFIKTRVRAPSRLASIGVLTRSDSAAVSHANDLRRPLLAVLVCLLTACASADDRGAAVRAVEPPVALAEWQPLAEGGDPMAQFLVGLAHDEGRDTAEDPRAAARWYRMAAEQGHAAARNNLGLLHYEGRGVERSHA